MKKLRKTFRRAKKFLRNDVRGELLTYLPVRADNRVIGTYDDQHLKQSKFLVSTKKGFLLLADGQIRHLLAGQFFGISALEQSWYVFQRMSYRSGRVVRFTLTGDGMSDCKQVITKLSPGCHQIDFLDAQLYIMDTYNNRLLVFDRNGSRWSQTAEYYPGGTLSDGRKSPNYAHMNSLWRSGDGDIWLMFHNETLKTGNHSEIVRLDANHEIAQRITTDASNAHNVVSIDGKFLYCDSLASTVVHGDQVVYRSEYFTRGLAVTDDLVLVGHSQYGARELRDELGGSIAVLDRHFNLLQVIPTPGMVQDIRAASEVDLAMSQSAAPRQLEHAR